MSLRLPDPSRTAVTTRPCGSSAERMSVASPARLPESPSRVKPPADDTLHTISFRSPSPSRTDVTTRSADPESGSFSSDTSLMAPAASPLSARRANDPFALSRQLISLRSPFAGATRGHEQRVRHGRHLDGGGCSRQGARIRPPRDRPVGRHVPADQLEVARPRSARRDHAAAARDVDAGGIARLIAAVGQPRDGAAAPACQLISLRAPEPVRTAVMMRPFCAPRTEAISETPPARSALSSCGPCGERSWTLP